MKWLLGLLVFGITLALTVSMWGVRINTTCSARRGIWIPASDQKILRGRYVEICPQVKEAAYLGVTRNYVAGFGSCPRGHASLIKRVIAVAGDDVHVSVRGIRVNGVLQTESRLLSTDSAGRKLPAASSEVVCSGTVWVLSNSARGFDSRYFGPILLSSVQQVITPLVSVGRC